VKVEVSERSPRRLSRIRAGFSAGGDGTVSVSVSLSDEMLLEDCVPMIINLQELWVLTRLTKYSWRTSRVH